MRVGLGGDDGPFFFSCPDATQHECCERGPKSTFAWGCFRDFVSGPCVCTAIVVEDARERAYEALRCVRDTRSLGLRAYGEIRFSTPTPSRSRTSSPFP